MKYDFRGYNNYVNNLKTCIKRDRFFLNQYINSFLTTLGQMPTLKIHHRHRNGLWIDHTLFTCSQFACSLSGEVIVIWSPLIQIMFKLCTYNTITVWNNCFYNIWMQFWSMQAIIVLLSNWLISIVTMIILKKKNQLFFLYVINLLRCCIRKQFKATHNNHISDSYVTNVMYVLKSCIDDLKTTT